MLSLNRIDMKSFTAHSAKSQVIYSFVEHITIVKIRSEKEATSWINKYILFRAKCIHQSSVGINKTHRESLEVERERELTSACWNDCRFVGFLCVCVWAVCILLYIFSVCLCVWPPKKKKGGCSTHTRGSFFFFFVCVCVIECVNSLRGRAIINADRLNSNSRSDPTQIIIIIGKMSRLAFQSHLSFSIIST